MRHVISDEIADFAAIFNNDIELVSVSRPETRLAEEMEQQLYRTGYPLTLQWRQDDKNVEVPAAKLLHSPVDGSAASLLVEEIVLVNEILHELLGCKEIGIRLATLDSPMCPRFHVDAVACRMLLTVFGPSTEWIANEDVDFSVLADRGSELPPVASGRGIRRLLTGGISLLKGGCWQEGFEGVIHRSPNQSGKRLLISFDPIFSL